MFQLSISVKHRKYHMTCHSQLPAGLLPLPPTGYRPRTFMTSSCSQDTVLVSAFHLDLSHIWLLFIHMTWLFVRIILVHIHQRLLRTRRGQRNQEQWFDRAWIDLIIPSGAGLQQIHPDSFSNQWNMNCAWGQHPNGMIPTKSITS